MSMLSVPMPMREIIRQRFICRIIPAVMGAYVTSNASALPAACRMASGVDASARRNSAPIFDSTAWAGSRLGKGESERATRSCSILADPRFLHMLHQREHHRPIRRHQNILLQPRRLLETRMPRKRLDGEVHVLLDFRRVLERIGAGNPHALISRQPDAMRKLLQRHRPVFVIVVFIKGGGHVR